MDFSPHEIKVIGFDADDTLWLNEILFRETERKFNRLMEPWLTERESQKELFRHEMETLKLYGYGIKGFMLAMISAAISISNGQVDSSVIEKIIRLGQAQLNAPVELLEDVDQVLGRLQQDYRLIVATKGDLLDQERKLRQSGLERYFHHVEIMSDKTPESYRKLVRHLDIQPHQFVMVGNSLKSDIIPVLDIGSPAIHIPHHTTWIHEHVEDLDGVSPYLTIDRFSDLVELFRGPGS